MRYLLQMRDAPFGGSHLMFGSDYSGDHGTSEFRVYSFIVADEEGSPDWPPRCRAVRDAHLTEGRRMAFKNMNDGQRRRALIPFLEAAECLDGHVVVVAVTKKLVHLSASASAKRAWDGIHGLQASWDLKTFEQMTRVAHFFSMLLGVWSSPGMDVTWITDEDSVVANPRRLDDMHQFAASISGLYVPHRLGTFAMNTASYETDTLGFEDFVAIPDLAAGMISEVLMLRHINEMGRSRFGSEGLSDKADVIADWFWHRLGSLKKTCIKIDAAEGKPGQFGIGELKMKKG